MHLFFLEDDMGAGYFSEVRGWCHRVRSPDDSPK
jgi:hypothetical protein